MAFAEKCVLIASGQGASCCWGIQSRSIDDEQDSTTELRNMQ